MEYVFGLLNFILATVAQLTTFDWTIIIASISSGGIAKIILSKWYSSWQASVAFVCVSGLVSTMLYLVFGH
jgi:inner membrane protein involved in colicin E2 resistance